MNDFYYAKNNELRQIQFGDWTICSLNDGYIDLDQRMFADIEPAILRQQLIEAKIQCVDDLIVRTQVHAFLVVTEEHLILIDTGCGTQCGPATGFLANSLRQTGRDLNQISLVLITHLHPDHIGGLLTEDGTPAFAEATVCVSAIEAAYWRDPIQEAMANEDNRSCFALARKMLAPYEANGRLRLIHPGDIIVPGAIAVEASGHTPGHMGFLFTSKNESLLLWGDIVHSEGIQFANPTWNVAFDIDGQQAAVSRLYLFEKVADQHMLVGGAHLPHSGLGYVSKFEAVFRWEPFTQE